MKITLTRARYGLSITPAPSYVTSFLKYKHRTMEVVRFKKRPVFKEVLLHRPDPQRQGGVTTLPGFFTSVCELIQKNGDSYEVVDLRAPMPDPDWERIDALSPRDYQIDPLVEFITKGMDSSGLITACGGFGKTYCQAFTYGAWHNLNTILAIPLKQVFRQTYNKFKELFPEKHIGAVGDGMNDISPDITITTFKSLPNCAIEKCQLLLVDEVQDSTGEKIQETIGKIPALRKFGFTATDDGLYSGADKLITGLFGSRLIHIPYEEGENVGAVVPGVVWFVRLQNPQLLANDMDTVFKKGIKVNEKRNRLIANVCANVPPGWTSLTFVDHVEDHLISLHKVMPEGVEFLHRDSDKKRLGIYALSSKQQDKIVQRFSNKEFDHLIATDAFRAGVDIPHLNVVVQAAGGSSKVEVIQEALRGSRTLPQKRKEELGISEDKTHFVLVDFTDEHHESLAGMSNKRRKYYEEQGWSIKYADDPSKIDWTWYPGKEKLTECVGGDTVATDAL